MELHKYDLLGRPEDTEVVSRTLSKYTQLKFYPKSPDMIIVVGGDGYILSSEVKPKVFDRNVLRVHFRKTKDKTLGAAADIKLRKLDLALQDITNQDYFLQEEKLIDCFIDNKFKDTAINEVAIRPVDPSGTTLFETTLYTDIRPERLIAPKGGGLIVSTKYGSMAEAANTGGPINIDADDTVEINFENTPVKQEHYICKRDDLIVVKLYRNCLVTVDRSKYPVERGSKVMIQGSDRYIKFIRTKNTLESFASKIKRINDFNLSTKASSR